MREKSDRLSKGLCGFSPREHGRRNQRPAYDIPGCTQDAQELGKSLDSGIIDAAGRRWRPDTYVEMLTRTKMMNTYREATTISALSEMCSMQSYPARRN
ncbi:hypothetical protein P7H19_10540 [Paenibacillus larvae]|nr:hypothetical protein [Paenibacillus larvae]MDT2236643.1 hypothetical protein [Paenibacillus larvae]